ncbi:MAG: hypothetical protein JXR68_07060 [Bacteroidales bacterium]|nr:hypothetical protein [Bacteroidales bacterium]
MKIKFFIAIIFSFAIFVNSCKTTCCHNITPVSFGANLNVLNCLCTAKVFVDGNEIGTIPGSVNDVTACDNENTLNVEFGESEHFYEIIVLSDNDTIAKQIGIFDVTKHDCVKIFFDLTK